MLNIKKIFNNFNLRLVIIECLSLVFIISGVKRFYIAYNGKLYDVLMNEDWEKYESLTDLSGPELLVNEIYWFLTTLLISILVIVLINWKNKFGHINSIAVIIITLGISSTEFYSSGFINRYLNYFCGIFAEGYGMAFLVGGSIILLVGVLILWKTITLHKKQNINNDKTY